MNLFFRTFEKNSTTGLPLVILHGLFGSSNNWAGIAKKLSLAHTVYTIDLRNHGQSPHADSMSFIEMAGDVIDLLDKHDLQKVYILGHSMGGKVAMQMAALKESIISKLIIVDIAPRNYQSRHQYIFDAINLLNEIKIESRKQAEDAIEHIIHDESERQFLLTNLTRQNDGSLNWRINMKVIQSEYQQLSDTPDIEINHTINTPTLIIRGADSNYIQDSDIPKLSQIFPNNTISTIQEAGHWVHAQQPSLFVKTVNNFLSEC